MSPGWTIDTHGPGAVADLEWNPPRPGYQLGEAVSHSSFSALITSAGNDLVAVVLQYRLGPFGFLAGNNTAELGVLNAGLLDQVCFGARTANGREMLTCPRLSAPLR